MTELVTIENNGAVLHAVLHPPAFEPERRVGVLFATMELNAKAGPHRLYYWVAEALANAGFYALRFDYRGTCDSPGFHEVTFADRLADVRAATAFFRKEYRLEAVVGWGLCMGAMIALHNSVSENADERPDALILCEILADPAKVSLPKYGTKRVELGTVAREMFFDGNLLRKLWRAPKKLHVYRRSLPKIAARLIQRYRTRDPELGRFRAAIARVGTLLAEYPGPCLLVYAEKPGLLEGFRERVNPGDCLGLAKKPVPPEWLLVKDADHVFATRDHTAEVIRKTVEWVEQFQHRYLPRPVHS